MSADLTFDWSYLGSIKAVLKITCLLCTLIGFLCIVCSARVRPHNLRGALYLSVTTLAFVCSSCCLLAGVLQPWQYHFHFDGAKYEMFLNGFLASAIFVVSAVTCSMDVLEYSVATFFGFVAACTYAYEAYLGYRERRKCNVATQTQVT